MNWIKVAPVERIAERLSRDSGGLKVLVVRRGDEVEAEVRPVRTPGTVDVKARYESDMEDVAWELGLRAVAYGRR